jgi:hypothetical protein
LAEIGEQLGGGAGVVGLAGGDHDLEGHALGGGQSMDFRSKTAPASSWTSIGCFF